MSEFPTHHYPRSDAVAYQGRAYVPTIYGRLDGNTKWVHGWDDFRAAGGIVSFNEDQTEVLLALPAGYKFAIGFQRP